MNKDNTLNKLHQLLSIEQKKRFYIIVFCLFFGMILEAFGIGVILPILNVMIDPESLKKVKWVNDFFVSMNLFEDHQKIIFSLSFLIVVYFFKSLYLVWLNYYQNRYISYICSDISFRT